MAPRLLYKMNYQSDIEAGGSNGTGLYEDFPVDIALGFEDCVPTGVTVRADSVCQCTPRGLFIPRRVEGKFIVDDKCVLFRVPVPTPGGVEAAVGKLKDCGAICVDVLGEEWTNVPPKIVGFVPNFALIYQFPTDKSLNPKVSGVMSYSSDSLGDDQPATVRYDANPVGLTGATIDDEGAEAGGRFLGCHGILTEAFCAPNSGIFPRKVIAVSRQQAGADAAVKLLQREAPVKSIGDIIDCMTSFNNVAACLRYRGESVKYADLLLGV